MYVLVQLRVATSYLIGYRSSVLISTRSSVILGDILVLIVTWYKTYSTWKTAASVAMKASFSTMILRDGSSTICFVSVKRDHKTDSAVAHRRYTIFPVRTTDP